jgi:hypothetical protein
MASDFLGELLIRNSFEVATLADTKIMCCHTKD